MLPVNVLNDFAVEHSLAIASNAFLVGSNSVNEPSKNFTPAATACVFRKPSVGIILNVYFCVHDLCPFLQSLDHVIRFLNRKFDA